MNYGGASAISDLRVAEITPIVIHTGVKDLPVPLANSGLALLMVEGRPNQLDELSVDGAKSNVKLARIDGRTPVAQIFSAQPKGPTIQQVLSSSEAGFTRFLVFSSGQGAGALTASLQKATKPVVETAEQASKIRMGEVKYWSLEGKVGDLIRLEVDSKEFLSRIVVENSRAESIVQQLAEGEKGLRATFTLPASGTFFMSVSCESHAGSGNFKYRLTRPKVEQLSVGKAWSNELLASETHYLELKLTAGSPIVVTGFPEQQLNQLSLLSLSGKMIAQAGWNEALQGFVLIANPSETGTYRLVISNGDSKSKVRVRWTSLGA